MQRWIGRTMSVLALLVAAACGSAQDPGTQPAAAGGKEIAAGDVCPSTDAAKPDACPDGCAWNGTECRANRPIVIFDRPAPTSTSTSTGTAPIQPPVQPPSTP